MYNLHLTVRESIDCFIVTCAVSDTADDGYTEACGSYPTRFFERLDEAGDDLMECLLAVERWAKVESNSMHSTSSQIRNRGVDSTVGGGVVGSEDLPGEARRLRGL